MARTFKDEVRTAIEGGFRKNENMRLAFSLGECVDQGLRPPGVHARVYRFELNTQRWVWKRSQPYRREVAKYRKQMALFLVGRSRPFRLSPDMLSRPRPPSLPEKTMMVWQICPPRPARITVRIE